MGTPAATAVNANVAQLCFGTGPTELNLRAVQQRVADLIRVIHGLLYDMETKGAHWTGFLDKLAVINMTHSQVMMEVRPLLRQYTVYPKFVDNPGIENALPEMLASRLLPDQVDQESVWKMSLPGGLAQLAAQPSNALDYAHGQVVELQELVGWLTNLSHTMKSVDTHINPTPRDLPVGVLDPKGKLRKDIEATGREIVQAAAAAVKNRERAGTALLRVEPRDAAAGQKRPRGEEADVSEEHKSDDLIAKIMNGELWPRYQR